MMPKGESCVPELIAKPALANGPFACAGATLALHDPGPITAVALFPGGAKAAARGLKALGLAFPAPGSFSEKGAGRLVWTGRDQAFLTGIAAPALDGAALTDQTDGWACLRLTGPGAVPALARLVALDLRPAALAPGSVARCGLNHLPAILLRLGDDAFEIMVFRSMARTAWAEIAEVLERLAARGAA